MFNGIVNFTQRYVSAQKYYATRFPEWDGHQGSQIACPFHEDNTPSFSVNIGTIGGCYCHAAGCRKRIGSIIHLEKEVCNLQTDKDAARKIYSEFYHPVIEFDAEFGVNVTQWRANLHDKSPDLLRILRKELGFTDAIIDRFDIGWDWEKKRFTFPVFNQWGDLVNVRYYKAPSQRSAGTKFKIINHKGFGSPATLYPLNILEKAPNPGKVLYWMKAERDVILAWSMGIMAFCSTGGEGDAPEKYTDYIKRWGCRIVVVPANDDIEAGQRKLDSLQNTNLPYSSVIIPEGYKDFSDWIIDASATASDFYALPEIVGNSSPLELISTEPIHLPQGFVDMTLNPLEGEYDVATIGHRPEFLNSAIRVKGVISARQDRTYSIPHIVEVSGKLFRIPISRELVQMSGVPDLAMKKILMGILKTTKEVSFRQYVTVTEVEVIPVLVPGKDVVYVNQKCFFFGENFECNLPYNMLVIPTSSMKTQETIGLIYEATPIANVLDHSSFSMGEIDVLKHKFAIKEDASGEEVYLALSDLSLEITNRWTQIYNRNDLLMVQLLTWCCPLQFNFHHEGIQRGWMNTLVLGDTKTGKSETAKKLRALFDSGVVILSENCSFVGLIGGAIKCSSGAFMLRWGKIPLYNRQLVVVEELSGLTTDEISRMSDVRSSGVARLDKGGLSGETSAMTRLLCISNVRRTNSNLGDFNYGVKAVQELIGQNEDVSRFDLILTVTDSEVSNELINKDRSKEPRVEYDAEERELFCKLIKFIWSLKPDQIEITEGAYKKCLEETLTLSKIYHSAIPIFKGGSDRIKLARVATAIAATQFSWDASRGKLIVTEGHVKAASMLLKKCYNKPSLGYGKYSKQQFIFETIVDEPRLTRTIKTLFPNDVTSHNFFKYLAANGMFEKEEINQSLNLSYIYTERLISVLLLSNIIRRSATSSRIVWETTQPGRKWIEKHYAEK